MLNAHRDKHYWNSEQRGIRQDGKDCKPAPGPPRLRGPEQDEAINELIKYLITPHHLFTICIVLLTKDA